MRGNFKRSSPLLLAAGASLLVSFFAYTPALASVCPAQNGDGSIQCAGSNVYCGGTCVSSDPVCPNPVGSPKTQINCNACGCDCPAATPYFCASSNRCNAGVSCLGGQTYDACANGGTGGCTGNANVVLSPSAAQSGYINITSSGNPAAPASGIVSANGMNIDNLDQNAGTVASGALRFGGLASGEGLFSRRAAGTNQYGLELATNSLSRLAIMNGGNVGIGTNNPTQKLQVVGGGIALDNAQSIYWKDSGGSQFNALYVDNTNKLRLRGFGGGVGVDDSGGLPLMTITNAGNVGIGIPSPTYKLHVGGTFVVGAAGSGFGGAVPSSAWSISTTSQPGGGAIYAQSPDLGTTAVYGRANNTGNKGLYGDGVAASSYGVYADSSNASAIGGYFRNTAGGEALHVDNLATFTGSLKLTPGAGAGKVLTSDAAGVGTWQAVPSAPVTSVAGSGAGISVSPTTGAVVVSNTGVTSLVAGTGMSISGSTGAVTVTNTGVTGSGTTNVIPRFTGVTTIGNTNMTNDGSDTAIGDNAVATGSDAMAIGLRSTAFLYSVAIGQDSNAGSGPSNAGGHAMGLDANATGWGSMSFGDYSNATSFMSATLGSYANASGSQAMALGANVTASGTQSIALGEGISGNPLVNSVNYSLGVGFNSTIPTFFVGPGTGAGTLGNVGVGTTAPGKRLDVSGDIRASGELTGTLGTGYGQVRMIAGNYGTMFRNDGSDTYFLATASGDQYGGWNGLRPLRINDITGNVYFANGGVSVDNASSSVSMNGNLSVGGVFTCLQGYCPANNAMRMTPNFHLNAYAGYAVIANWDNGTTGNSLAFRVGNGAGSDAMYVAATGNTSVMGKLGVGGDAYNCGYDLCLWRGSGMWTNGQVYAIGGLNIWGDSTVHNRFWPEGVMANQGIPNCSWWGYSGFTFGGNEGCGDTGMFSTGDGVLRLYANGTLRAQYTMGGAFAYNSSEYSDRRIKEDIKPYTDGLAVLRKVNPVSFTFNGLAESPKGVKAIGVIAQEVQEIMPYAITTTPEKLHPTDAKEAEILTVDMQDLSMLSINAIKELDAKVTGLEQENARLKLRLDALEKLVGTGSVR